MCISVHVCVYNIKIREIVKVQSSIIDTVKKRTTDLRVRRIIDRKQLNELFIITRERSTVLTSSVTSSILETSVFLVSYLPPSLTVRKISPKVSLL